MQQPLNAHMRNQRKLHLVTCSSMLQDMIDNWQVTSTVHSMMTEGPIHSQMLLEGEPGPCRPFEQFLASNLEIWHCSFPGWNQTHS